MSATALSHTPLGSLRPGMDVDSVYLVREVSRRSKANGDPWFQLELSDASGQLGAVMWDRHDALLNGLVKRDEFARVQGAVAEYKGSPQMTLTRIAAVPEGQVDPSAFVPVSPVPRAELEARLDAVLAGVQRADCARLLAKVFGHAKLRDLYCTAPAAMRLHHAYLHGLLEHSLSVLRHATNAAAQYEPVDRDMLTTGVLLHDIGKVRELSWRHTLSYTDEGRLMGHVSLGAIMMDAAMRELQREPEGFPEDTRRHILHMILSHHGKMEWGAATVPKTREAMLLHYADYMDAYMVMATDEMRRAQSRGDAWTPFVKVFDSYLYAGPAPAAEHSPAALPPMPHSGPADDFYAQTGRTMA